MTKRYLDVKTMFQGNSITVFSKTHESHYKTAIAIFKDKKIFGAGVKSFRHVCKNLKYNPQGCATHPHNTFLQFLSELGLLGIIFYIT